MANAVTKHDQGQAAANDGAMVLGSDKYRGALEPATTGEAFSVAEMMASIGYCGVTSPAEALGRIMTGRGLGLSAMQSLRGVYTVHGRPGIDAALMHALCLASPLCEKFSFVAEESDDTKATFIAKRRGDDAVKHTFTIEDAERMGVLDRGSDDKAKKDNNWNKVRKAMLRARAKSELARLVFPDLIFGMYSKEELEEIEPPRAPHDPTELAGEILSQEEAAADAAAGRVTVVQAAKRDYAGESEALIAKARAAKTRPELAAVRQAIEAWDGVPPHRDRVVEAYNEAKKASRAPAATPAPEPMPDGNLFAGKDSEQP